MSATPRMSVTVVAGAAVLKQLSFKGAMNHKALVAEVAGSARSQGKQPILGVLFDEVSRLVSRFMVLVFCFACCIVSAWPRKFWEEESGKKGDRFCVERVVGTRGSEHDMLLNRANVLYDTLFESGKAVSCAILA